MLLLYGEEKVRSDWKVNEAYPVIYSRVYYVDDGEVTYTDAEQQKKLKKGCLYILPTTMPYCVEHNPLNSFKCIYMHLDLAPNLVSSLVEIDLRINLFLFHLFESLREVIRSKETKIISIISDAFIEYCNEKNLLMRPSIAVKSALEYIWAHFKEDISIEVLSNISGYNPQYFIRVFRKCVGITPHQYIMSYRLKEAAKLFKTNMNFSEIAHEVGYFDVKSFSRAFKLKYGFSPSRFKNPNP